MTTHGPHQQETAVTDADTPATPTPAETGHGSAATVVDPSYAGRVLSSEAATPMEFWVAVEQNKLLQLDDVVCTRRTLPAGAAAPGVVTLYGVVDQIEAKDEAARPGYPSDTHRIQQGVIPTHASETAHILVTRAEPEIPVPPAPGAAVHLAVGADRDAALDFTSMDVRLPAGLSRKGEPIYIDYEFINGERGAHINISGISGVATKTSYATFLLYSIMNSGAAGAATANTKGLIFNVKSQDLMFLDHANTRLTDADRAKYALLGLPAGPFRSVGILAPPRRGSSDAVPDSGARTYGARPLYWTIEAFCEQKLLPFLFADSEDEQQQYTIVMHNVAARLARCDPAGGGAIQIEDSTITTFSQLVDAIEGQLHPDDDATGWAGRAVTAGTINAFMRRLGSAARHVEHLIRADIPDASDHCIDLDSAQVTVVDIHNLHDRAQRFVVGVVLRQAFEAKEASGSADPRQFVVLDELNKYAPREGRSPIKELLLDVAERGRSLGVLLIGAQQTASEVERRVVSNCSVRVVGRLDAAEAQREQYGFMPATQRQRATILKPGSLYVAQPRLPVPLLTEFPFPAWATRAAEADQSLSTESRVPEDPFDVL